MTYYFDYNVYLCGMKAFGDFVRFNKELGINEYDITVYASFFADNIQLHLQYDDKGNWVYDGLSYDEFAIRWDNDPDRFCNALQKMLADEELGKLQDEIEEEVGIRIDYFNFYPLCAFVDALVRERYFVLLKPTAKDTVMCHYEGFLIDGTVFDSSVQRGEPAVFPLDGVIVGWTEGLQLMREGGKYRFFIPYKLGYGEGGAGASIPPFATLVFDVELLEVL